MTQEDQKNRERIGGKFNRRGVLKGIGAAGAGLTIGSGFTGVAAAAPGDLLGEVQLPDHSSGVAITFDGTFVYTMDGLSDETLQIYSPPDGGDGTATLEAEKSVVDESGNPVTLSAVEWDPGRGKLWGAYNGANSVYLVDIGDPTDASQDAVASFEFAPNTGGFSLTDGLAYDGRDDTLWYTPDVSDDVWHFESDGTLIKTIPPKNSSGNVAGLISGVAMGTDQNGRPTIFCGRNGESEIIRVYADDGEFIESFADLPFRVEDLACDPVTYGSEAILTKDAFDGFYVAFEVQPGSCPIAGQEEPEENQPPVAECDMSFPGEAPDVDEALTFDGSGSTDPDGDELTYEWDFDGDGTTDAMTAIADYTYTTAGEKTVTLTVTDPDGASDTCELTFVVNTPPEAECDMSFSGDNPLTGDPITFDGSGSSDPDGDSLTFEWDFDGDGTTDETGETVSHTFDTAGEKTVTLTVTDEPGSSDTCELTFTVFIGAVIDIKPCSDPNAFNPTGKGVVPVGIQQTDTFDPTTRIDVGTLRFGAPDVVKGGDGATAAHGGHVEDVVPCEGDGMDDLVVHFPVEETGFDGDEEVGRLEGETNDGTPVVGEDSVKLAGRGSGGGGSGTDDSSGRGSGSDDTEGRDNSGGRSSGNGNSGGPGPGEENRSENSNGNNGRN